MISTLSNKLANALYINMRDKSEEPIPLEIYEYGLELVISSIINVLILFTISSICGLSLEMLIYLISFASLRINSGGFHATTKIKCLLYFGIVSFIMIGFINGLERFEIMTLWIIVCTIISVILIFLYSPVDSIQKPMNSTEKDIYRKKSRLLISILAIIFILLILMWKEGIKYLSISSGAIMTQTITLIPILNKREES